MLCAKLPHCLSRLAVLQRNLLLLDKFVDSRDSRFLARVLRYTNFLRKHIDYGTLRAAVDTNVTSAARRAVVHGYIDAAAAVRPDKVSVPYARLRVVLGTLPGRRCGRRSLTHGF